MKNIPKANKKAAATPKVIIANSDNNLKAYQYFYLSAISILFLIDILFQRGVTNVLIRRAWGMNNFSYAPLWTQVIIFSILFALAIPTINDKFRLFIQKLTSGLKEKTPGKFKKAICFIAISALVSLLFYLLRVKFDLLGDMNLRVTQTEKSQYINDEYLTMYLLHYFTILLQKLHHFTYHDAFVIHSILAGFFYCLFGLLITDLLFAELRTFIVFFLFYISIGTLLVYCGYVEIYAIPAASVSLYMYTSLLFLKQKVHILVPFFFLILAITLHLEQVSLLPSFVFLAVRKQKVFLKYINAKTFLLLFVASVPVIYLLNSKLNLTSLTPLTKIKGVNAYTVFSWSHFWEFFNAEYISSGIYLFLFILTVVAIYRKKIKEDMYSLFFLIVTLFSLSIVFTTNKERGSGDWDICSFPAISLSLFVAYNLLTKWSVIYSPKKLFYVTSIALVLNTFSCWTWIGINSSAKKSMNKIEDMILTDPGYYYATRLPSEAELSLLFDMYGTRDKAKEYYKLSYEKYNATKPFVITNYVGILMRDKDTNTALPIIERTIAVQPYYFNGYNFLFSIYNVRKQYDKIYSLAKVLVAAYNSNPNAVLNDPNAKAMLISCVTYLYNASIAKNDQVTTQDMLVKMQQLHINLKRN